MKRDEALVFDEIVAYSGMKWKGVNKKETKLIKINQCKGLSTGGKNYVET